LLTACSDSKDKKPLPGERVSILELQKHLEPDSTTLNAQGFVAPAAWDNDFWPQAGGYPNHDMQHVVIGDGALKQVWTARIGDGASRAFPLTAQPVIAEDRVYTLDTDANLRAFSVKDGKKLWSTDVKFKGERDSVIGGGVAYSQSRLFVTAGYNELLCLNPIDGKFYWRAPMPAPSRAAPSVVDQRVFVTTLDNKLLAFDLVTGKLLWDYAGLAAGAGLIGAASPAVGQDVVIPAFSSGEVTALRVENGTQAWSESLASFSADAAGGVGGMSDVRGLPVVDKGAVFAVSYGGRLVAIDERTGDRIWQRDIGSAETPWVAGNYLFVLSTNNEVVALGRDNGVIAWVKQLPRFANEDKKSDPLFWTGPVLAGGRIILAGSNGDLIELSPNDGKVIRTTKLGRAVSLPLSVAGGTLYILADDGTLMAFR
jgi:outer membrane protein assembly factor BamB